MTAWSLEHMGIAIYCLSYIENLRQAFTAATLSCCLFVALYALSFVFSYWKAYSVGLRSGDSRGHQRISNFLPLRNYSGSFAVCCVIIHLHWALCCLHIHKGVWLYVYLPGECSWFGYMKNDGSFLITIEIILSSWTSGVPELSFAFLLIRREQVCGFDQS